MNKYARLAILLSLILAAACRPSKKITTAEPKKCSLDHKSAKTLIAFLKQNELKFDRLSAKFSVDFRVDSNSYSFNVTMRAKRDSIIWMSISPLLGIEVAKAVLTKDSLMFVDKINGRYFKGDLNYISKILQADVDFEMLQSLLTGNSTEFYDEDEKLKPGIDSCRYILGTVRKRKLKKVIEKNKELKDPLQTIWLIPGTYKIDKLFFNDFATNRTFEALYGAFEKVDSAQAMPRKADYYIKAQKNVAINIQYSKVTLNKVQEFPFVIPESYEPIILKEK